MLRFGARPAHVDTLVLCRLPEGYPRIVVSRTPRLWTIEVAWLGWRMSRSEDLLHLTRRLKLEGDESVASTDWRPAADLYRTPEGWLVKVELAGVERDGIQIALRGRYLSISGERRDEFAEDHHKCYSLEIAYSRFQRTLALPGRLDDAEIVVQYRQGILLIRIVSPEAENERY